MEDNIIIELKNITRRFDDMVAVENVNLKIKKGEFVTLLGPSGCGKTTTLRMIAGFDVPTEGSILLNGKDITNIPPYQRPINTVFQRYALFPYLDVYDNIAFGLKLKKIVEKTTDKHGNVIERTRKLTIDEIDEKVTAALKIVDLEEFEWRDISTLSGGQQQRVAIARAIVNEPEILLLDEPLGALDLKMRKDMQLELKAMHEKLGITFIYVTHDQEEALTMSDTIVVMEDGVIQQVGSPVEIYNEPNNAFVADFIGESNIYSGNYIGDKKVRFLGHVFECVDVFEKNTNVDVVVRPEDIKLCSADKGDVKGKIVSKIFKGVHYEYTMIVGKSEVVIQDTRDFELGEMGFTIEPDMIHIMNKIMTNNVYDGYINKSNEVCFADGIFEADLTQLLPKSHIDEEGYLVDERGVIYDLTDANVKVTIGLNDIEIIDNEEDGEVAGEIVSIIYKGDHYQVIIRTEEEDFVVDTEYTWNENDRVSVHINKENIKLKLKEDIKNYVKV